MMIGLTVVNYGYPIAQLALAEGGVGAGHSDREPVMAEPARTSWRNPWVRGSVGVAGRADGRRDAGRLRLAAVGAGRLQRAGPLGEHLPRRRRSARPGPATGAARDAAPVSTEVVLERSMARGERSDAVGRGATAGAATARCATARKA